MGTVVVIRSFVLVFALIAGPAQAGGLYPSYIRKHYPASMHRLMIAESNAEDACREGLRPDGQAEDVDGPVCKHRDRLVTAIEKRGWCWGPDEAIEADRQWMRVGRTCHNP